MRRLKLLPVFGCFFVVLLLAACVQSETPLLTNLRPDTPFPVAFVVVNEVGTPEANRFDRDEDTYVAVENGVRTTYRLYPIEDMTGPVGPFFIAVETNERASGANYGLVELAPGVIALHSFDAQVVASGLGLQADEFGIEVVSDDQLLDVFRRVAGDAADGRTSVSRFKVLDLADPEQRTEAEAALEEIRKAREAEGG